MKKILLSMMLVAIYLLSSTTGLLVLQPHTWFNWNIDYFLIDFHYLFQLNSDFYKGYEIHLNDQEFIARKLCHFTFFGFLSVLFFINLHKWKMRYSLSWGFTTIYAILDELHQFSVPGRTGSIQDVFVDSVSAFIWLFCFLLIRYFVSFYQRRFILVH